MVLKKIISWCLLIFAAFPLLAQKSGYWQQKVDYTIEVTLHDTVHTLDGHVAIHYQNNSPDTLYFLWIHLWPNAYKNDRTAYSEQSLLEGDLSFYFSKPDAKGYINRVNFTADGRLAQMEDHPQHIDISRLLLPEPLAPGKSVLLESAFHIQLPKLFSRSGYEGSFHAVTQWFPKVAMYDRHGWHEMPYLSAGEYYSNFGDYTVSITLPENYLVAATGRLENEAEKAWMKKQVPQGIAETDFATRVKSMGRKNAIPEIPASSANFKTLVYRAENVIDFAWFADKQFAVKFDTLAVENRIIELWNFQRPQDYETWESTMLYTKQAVQFFSRELGPYPYPQVSVVTSPDEGGGMEYPMVTTLNAPDAYSLDLVIAHEIGHNWLQSILATNERQHGWMDEGMNTYFEQKYIREYGGVHGEPGKLFGMPLVDAAESLLEYLEGARKARPIEVTPYSSFPYPYFSSIYPRAGRLFKFWEQEYGPEKMSSLFTDYYESWKFRHPQPGDFHQLAKEHLNNELNLQEFVDSSSGTRKPTGVSLKFGTQLGAGKDKYHIGWMPAIGFNEYDQLEAGLLLHNYTLPVSRFRFAVTPLFAFGTKKPVGYGHIIYDIFPKNKLHIVQPFLNAAHFHFRTVENSVTGEKFPLSYSKIMPGLRMEWKPQSPLSTLRKSLTLQTHLVAEQQVRYDPLPPPDTLNFSPTRAGREMTVIPELNFQLWNRRALYPWDVNLQLQQVKQLMRTSLTAHYFLNYGAGGQGASVRLFAGKIFYLTEKNLQTRGEHYRYHFTMYAPNGNQDYTYSTPFAERNQSEEIWGRQIAIRDGGFKYRSDYSAVLPGLKSTGADYFDNWMVAANFSFDLPRAVNPINLPFKIFADVGTSHSPWTPGAREEKFLYSVGAQLSLLNVVDIYLPVFQSKVFKEPNALNNPYRPGGANFWEQRVTFSLNPAALKKWLQSRIIY